MTTYARTVNSLTLPECLRQHEPTSLSAGLGRKAAGEGTGGDGVGRVTSTPLGASNRTTDRPGFAEAVYGVAKGRGTATLRLLDFGVITGAWALAYIAGFEGTAPFGMRGALPYLLIPVLNQLFFNQAVGLYGPVWRYASVEEAMRVMGAAFGGTLVSTFELAWFADLRHVSLPLLSTPPVAVLLILLGCGGIRFQARLFALERQRSRSADRMRALIVGANDAGVALALEVGGRPLSDAVVIGFVDEDGDIVGRSVRGLPVLGTTNDLVEICRAQRIDRILIALPHASHERVRAVMAEALKTDAQVKLLSAQHGANEPLLGSLRDLDLADLLGREHAPVDTTDIAGYLEGATVLVTGAGGSIGSEIARQVERFSPARLLLLDRDESLLYETVTSLVKAEPVLADIRDGARVREIFDRFEPDVVFHAAAHKHVPILESHPVEAVQTNLLGTWQLAQICAEQGTRLVHVSTDKAAEPCSVMGASKRAAELAVLAVGEEFRMPFAAVRFGNVLGSRGSVVPTFFRQILEGGPITVTDPGMTRYFMTIPEAVSLVLQAGAMAADRKVFVLDMGQPIPIIELARQMIRLAGLRPGEDIEIEIVGTRPGERLHERLYDDSERAEPTWHPSICGLAPNRNADRSVLERNLENLARSCADADDAAAASGLVALLRECGVQCDLEGVALAPCDDFAEIAAERPRVDVDLSQVEYRHSKPALLGGTPEFPAGLPFARPTRRSLRDVARRLAPSYDRGILTNGPLVAELEEIVAERLGVGYVVAVSSCTSGLMLVLQAVTDGRSGPVLVPSFTFSASAHAVAWNGRNPRFVECLRDTFQIDPVHTGARLDGASAVLATHVFGAPCDPRAVADLARAHGVPIVFDAAHAFGARTRETPIGGFGDAEVFSLTPTKPLVAGEGGLVATNDASLADTLRIGRDYGNPGDYDTRFPGLNARMSEFHAAVALASFDLLDDALAKRQHLASRYRGHLADINGIRFQSVPMHDFSTYKDFTITIDADEFGLTRDSLACALAAEGIDTRKYFAPPVHRQHAYRDVEREPLPVTDAVSSSVLSLPMSSMMHEQQVERVAAAVARIHENAVEIDAHIATQVPAVRQVFELD